MCSAFCNCGLFLTAARGYAGGHDCSVFIAVVQTARPTPAAGLGHSTPSTRWGPRADLPGMSNEDIVPQASAFSIRHYFMYEAHILYAADNDGNDEETVTTVILMIIILGER